MGLLVSLICVFLCIARCFGSSELNVCTANITEKNNGSLIVLYTRVSAADYSSCMHYVWNTRGNFSSGYPTLFASQTLSGESQSHTACTADCASFLNELNKSVDIPGAVNSYFSFAMVFTRLVEFAVDSGKAPAVDVFNATQACYCENENSSVIDDDDLCAMNYTSVYLNSNNITWGYDTNENSFVGLLPQTENDTVQQGKFHIKPTFPTTDADGQRLSGFPQTLYTANSTVLDLIIEYYQFQLNNASDRLSPNYSRIALEVFLVHGPHMSNGSVDSVVSLDDEYTPSVFTTNTYQVPSDSETEFGYLQWKPISYQSSSRKSTKSQQVNVVYTAGIDLCNTTEVPEGLAGKLFAGGTGNITRWFAVFGTPEDATYLPSSYFTWTSLVGYGQVPQDSISLVVIIIIIVGLGLPALLVFLGGLYVVYKKKPWENIKRVAGKVSGRRGGYTRLN